MTSSHLSNRLRSTKAGGGPLDEQITMTDEPIRIRTGHSYHVPFTITLGQRNARFVGRALTPLARYLRWFPWADAVSFLPEPGFDAIHTWNTVPLLTRRQFIATFEDYMPRTPDDRRIGWYERALRARLLSEQCVALIAISEYALRQFRQQHRDFRQLPELLSKTELVYPVMPARRTAPKQASPDGLRLLFVGRDFMRKGGPAVLRAHAGLRALGIPVETVIVSSLKWAPDDYVGPPDAAYVQDELRGLAQDGVIHHPSLASAAVHDLMDRADYLVFPTFHDTFGFVSLEAMAGGTPVIATDTCVLPEIITPGANGWLLPFENDAIGKWRWLYRQSDPCYGEAYRQTTMTLAAALVERLAVAWQGRDSYETLSAGAIETLRTRFDSDSARTRLEALYERFRGSGRIAASAAVPHRA